MCALTAAGLAACAQSVGKPAPMTVPTASVRAMAETAAVANQDDAADDPAIWVSGDGQTVRILGTDKRDDGGLNVYAVDGALIEFLPAGALNNVDVRPLPGDAGLSLAFATKRRPGGLELFAIDAGGTVTRAGSLPTTLNDPYGACLGAAAEGGFDLGATNTDDGYHQYQLVFDGEGEVSAYLQRQLSFGAQAEGCVFDERTGDLFIGVEEEGIFRYRADPAAGDGRQTVALIDDAHLTADVEGLAIYPKGADGGWLIASSQGDDAFAVFALPEARFVGRFTVIESADGQVDRVTHTDGLAVTARAAPGFPQGFLVVQDDENTRPDGSVSTQNFKIVDWREIAAALALE